MLSPRIVSVLCHIIQLATTIYIKPTVMSGTVKYKCGYDIYLNIMIYAIYKAVVFGGRPLGHTPLA